jgi:hypothetical protein
LDLDLRVVHALHEVLPLCLISVGIVDNPPGANVVNETAIVSEVGFKFDEQLILVDGIVDDGILGCWWSAHCGSIVLQPGGIAEGEYIIHHDNFEGFD